MRFEDEILIVNEAGEYLFISKQDFIKLNTFQLKPKSQTFLNLKSKHIVTDSNLALPIYLLATKYRTKKSFLDDFTALHIFIITLRCNQKCRYCQASSENESFYEYDMNLKTAKKSVDLVFKSPSPVIKIEFQGGEPLLNFEIVKFIVKYAEKLNKKHKKNLEFVLCTNLVAISDNILDFLAKHKILISTSLDGPQEIHDANRILRGGSGTYKIVTKNIKKAQSVLGIQNVAALMVTTKISLNYMKEIIDEYIKNGFASIFIRSLSPFGRASKKEKELGYNIDLFFQSYKKALKYIIKLNIEGTHFSEVYATIVLSRILTPFPTGFVDLQSPAGVGIGCAIYNYNGNVFVSDEARMLAKMGDKKFLMGNVHKHNYEEIFLGRVIRETIEASCVESLPQCSECAFQLFCGADPVRNYYLQGDCVGHRSTSEFHQKNYLVIKYLMELIRQNNPDVMNVFWSWITNRTIDEIKKIEKREHFA